MGFEKILNLVKNISNIFDHCSNIFESSDRKEDDHSNNNTNNHLHNVGAIYNKKINPMYTVNNDEIEYSYKRYLYSRTRYRDPRKDRV